LSSRRGRFRLLEPPPLVSSKDCDDEETGELGPVVPAPELLQVVQASDTGDSARSSSMVGDEHCAKLAVTSKLM
jgi:hypothetical protein